MVLIVVGVVGTLVVWCRWSNGKLPSNDIVVFLNGAAGGSSEFESLPYGKSTLEVPRDCFKIGAQNLK